MKKYTYNDRVLRHKLVVVSAAKKMDQLVLRKTYALIGARLKHFTKLLKSTKDRHTYSQSRRCIQFCITLDALRKLIVFLLIYCN